MPRKPFLVLWKVVLCSASSCVPVRSNSFCTGVTWNVSLGLPAAEVDEKAREDFEHVFAKYGKARGAGGLGTFGPFRVVGTSGCTLFILL